ncbi:hypothetical protein [Streptomyces montanus]|uniref:hypothetical protein n=1 Tax=Streptomyces montanus TaxID=2580423 RepID=UPI001485F68E|nr:hypothetical protein [Streptomyces montanus]
MPFEIYRPDLGQPRRKQRPAKLTVLHSETGGTPASMRCGRCRITEFADPEGSQS